MGLDASNPRKLEYKRKETLLENGLVQVPGLLASPEVLNEIIDIMNTK